MLVTSESTRLLSLRRWPGHFNSHFSRTHPLAEVAAKHCQQHRALGDLGKNAIACGACWELAIRDDERFIVEHELPRELDVDPTYIDDVAVRQTLAGQKVPLTFAERGEVARLRKARGSSGDLGVARKAAAMRDVA